ncbi:MAG: PAS domain-containing protein [Desulfobacterales bacterium]|jgi:transcriptional regulator with PAS, ATPase and Fis domain
MPEDTATLNAKIKVLEAQLQEARDQRRALEDELRHTRDRFAAALKALPVIIFATDADGSLVFFNREFERVTGYAAVDLLDETDVSDLLFHKDAGTCIIKDIECRKWQFTDKAGSAKVVVWSNISETVPLPEWTSWKIGLDLTELESMRDQVKVLQGLIPICAHCKKIRNDEGFWTQLESYLVAHSEADFTHGICPDCMAQYFSEYDI